MLLSMKIAPNFEEEGYRFQESSDRSKAARGKLASASHHDRAE